MSKFRYSEWDGSQEVNLDADQLMDEVDRLMRRYGDLSQALRAMQRGDMGNRQMPNLDKLMEQLRRRKQNQLDKYNLGSVMDDIRKKLDEILKTEREGIQRQLDEAEKKAQSGNGDLSPELRQKLSQATRQRAAQNLDKLDNLPGDVGGQIKELTQYDFMDGQARQQFHELIDMLKKNAMQSYMRDLTQKLKNMDANSLAAMRNLVESINQMMEARQRGEQPDFDSFMQQFGDSFGADRPQNFDELMERMRQQMDQAQALMESLSPEDRQELENLLNSMLDDATQMEMAKMAANLDALLPSQRRPRNYPFSGEESLSYTEALKLMEEMQKMDRLEQQMKNAQYKPTLDNIDDKLMEELLGEKAKKELEAIRDMAKLLEEAGYIRRRGNGYELTPEGIRKIGQKALKDIMSHLKKDRTGPHTTERTGVGTERIEETKKYEFGDDFHIHIQRTVMNSILREPGAPPVHLKPEDFEVLKTEESTRTAIVLLLDQSLSMTMNGYFDSAKRVAIALNSLIRSRYPKDGLHVLAFSRRAHEIKTQDLINMNLPYYGQGTNFQHALQMARKILAEENCVNKEIILVSDGEPTAHCEGNEVYFQYPPSLRTLQMTLREVRNCTAKGIIINTFMFDDSPFFTSFVTQMARINKGRVFFTNPDGLGRYLLVDYMSKKRGRVI